MPTTTLHPIHRTYTPNRMYPPPQNLHSMDAFSFRVGRFNLCSSIHLLSISVLIPSQLRGNVSLLGNLSSSFHPATSGNVSLLGNLPSPTNCSPSFHPMLSPYTGLYPAGSLK